jgi:endonuclease/exonuclease/phosphatase family metal-dependent hydrolase
MLTGLSGGSSPKKTFTVASFNIQAGARSDRYHDYVTKAWQHILPGPSKTENIRAIANAIARFDLVCLQEADGGSTRSGFVHQAHRLAELADFTTVLDQRNRKVGLKALPFACSGNAILARTACENWREHALPGAVQGRGAIEANLTGVNIFNLHLSLTANAQRMQLAYLAEHIAGKSGPLIVAGDFNCSTESPAVRQFIQALNLSVAEVGPSFPSWAPKRRIDLILYRGLALKKSWALPMLASDHLAVVAQFDG